MTTELEDPYVYYVAGRGPVVHWTKRVGCDKSSYERPATTDEVRQAVLTGKFRNMTHAPFSALCLPDSVKAMKAALQVQYGLPIRVRTQRGRFAFQLGRSCYVAPDLPAVIGIIQLHLQRLQQSGWGVIGLQ